MVFNFGIGGDMPTYTIEVYVGNALIEQQTIRPLALEMLVMQFAGLCEKIGNESQPMKCICKGTTEIELPNGDWVERPAKVMFYNKKWDGEFND